MVALGRAELEFESDEAADRLGAALDALETDRRLFDETRFDADNPHQLAIVRSYLWLLGYLKKDNGRATLDRDLESALRTFRSEAGLRPGATLEQATWDTLRRYVCFSPGPTPAASVLHPSRHPALRRIVHLRLFSYGLISRKPPHGGNVGSPAHDRDLRDGLVRLVQLASYLALDEATLAPTLDDARTLALVLDHDRMIERLPCAEQGIQVFDGHPDHPQDEVSARKLRTDFVKHLAEVELWLLGYMVRPGNFRSDAFDGDGRTDSLNKALRRFAKDHDIRLPGTDSIRIGAWFFEAARRALQEVDAKSDADAYATAHDVLPDAEVDQLLTQDKARGALRKRYVSIGARLVDGVRRAFSAIRRFVKWLFGGVRRMLSNLARVLHARALAVFRHLAAVVDVTRRGFEYLAGAPVGSARASPVHVKRDADFDLAVFVEQRATEQEIDRHFAIMDLHVRAMELGGRVIGKLFSLLRAALSLGRGAVGWLGLLLNLVKLGNWLRASADLAREAVEVSEALRAHYA